MRLKEIKPGMAIHCKTQEEKKALLEEAERIGYRWSGLAKRPTDKTIQSGSTLHFYDKNENCDFMHITWSDDTDGVTEFSDLILPDLTADEVLDILSEIRNCKDRDCYECPLDSLCGDNGGICVSDKEKILQICNQYKSDREKKEPEIETVDICRIIEIKPDGKKRCVHEEDISDGELMYSGDAVENCRYILKNYCKEHDGEFIAVHEVVSRVKKVI